MVYFSLEIPLKSNVAYIEKNTEVYEPNYFMTVYEASHNILWGYDPLSGNQNASDVVLWTDRGGNYTVERYDGDEAEVVPAGRFWMLKDSPVSPKERDLLAERGIVKYSGGVRQGKTLALFRSEGRIRAGQTGIILFLAYNINIKAESKNQQKTGRKTEQNGDGG